MKVRKQTRCLKKSGKMKALRITIAFCFIFSVFIPLTTLQVVAANPVVTVANETELRNAITNAAVPTTIELTDNIQLTGSTLAIPAGKDIELTGSDYTLTGVHGQNTIIVNGNLLLNGPTVTHNLGEQGTGILVGTTGTFTMNDGEITDNGGLYRAGGGVVNTGTFTMKNGWIHGNSATGHTDGNTRLVSAGGVRNEGMFIMDGGEISYNTCNLTCSMAGSASGGGVMNSGTFILNGGKISKNTAISTGGGGLGWQQSTSGGGVYQISGAFTMNGGIISENSSNNDGGGVYYSTRDSAQHSFTPGTFTMNGGKIYKNTARSGGGIYVGGTNGSGYTGGGNPFIMTAGKIADNITESDGGGIYNRGTTSMTGGKISDNISKGNGGGVFNNFGTFSMAGIISGNHADLDGGGVYTNNYNNISVSSGKTVSFSDNTARYAVNPPATDPIRTNNIDPSTTDLSTSFGTAFTNYDINYNNGTISYMVTANCDNNGTATPATQLVAAGSNAVVITMTPNTGFEIDTVTLKRGTGAPGSVTPNIDAQGVGTYIVSGVTSDCELTVTFKEKANITIRYQSENGGFVDRDSESLAPVTGIARGSTAGENPGYNFVGWIDESGITVCNDPTFIPEKVNGVNVAATYTALFTPRNYIVTATVGSAASTGTASPDSQTVTHGSNADVITMIPATGYEIDSVTLKQGGAAPIPITSDVTVNTSTGVGTYVITTVANDYELIVSFKEKANIAIHYQSEDTNRGTVDRASESLPPLTGNALGSTATSKPGYIVTHWTDSKGNTVRSAAAGASTDTFIPAKVDGVYVTDTYTAHFEVIDFEVHFDTNGGTPNTIPSINVTYNTLIMSHSDFPKPGDVTKAEDKNFTYTFIGWEVIIPTVIMSNANTQAIAGSSDKAPGPKGLNNGDMLESSDLMPAHDVYLMAKWAAKKKDLAEPKLSVVKKADRTTVAPGSILNYTITVSNKGTADAKDIVIKDYLPKYTTYDSSSPKGTLSKENGKDCVTWTIASLKAGKSFKINLSLLIDKDIPKGHSIGNTVSYTSGDGENTVTGSSNTAVVKYDGKPQTGDPTNKNLFILLMAAAALVGLAILLPSQWKRYKQNS